MPENTAIEPKIRMELVWHNCKTCPPSESRNENLILWDGHELIDVEWDNGYWWNDYHYIDMAGEEELCWWADLSQTTKQFFILNLGPSDR